MTAGSVLQTTWPPASAALRGVGRGYKQEKLLGERGESQVRDCGCAGSGGLKHLCGGYFEELLTTGSQKQMAEWSRAFLCAGLWGQISGLR